MVAKRKIFVSLKRDQNSKKIVTSINRRIIRIGYLSIRRNLDGWEFATGNTFFIRTKGIPIDLKYLISS